MDVVKFEAVIFLPYVYVLIINISECRSDIFMENIVEGRSNVRIILSCVIRTENFPCF